MTVVRRMPSKVTATGTRGLLQWLKVNQPQIYARARPHIARLAEGNLAGFTASLGLTDPAMTASTAPAPKSWSDSLRDIVMTASQAYLTREQMQQQDKLLNIQLQRAQAGLPMLDVDLQKMGLQSPQVNVGVAGDTLRVVGYVAGGLGLLYVLGKMLGGRNRGP